MDNDEILDQVFALPVARSLRTCAPAHPLPAQRKIVQDAVTLARSAGLVLPARLAVRWVAAPAELQRGETSVDAEGAIEMLLAVEAFPAALRATVLHECQHVSDYAAGLHLTLDRVELERRAVAFVGRCMGWD